MHKKVFVWALAALALVSCGKQVPCNQGILTEPLDNAAWNTSEWISAVDAPEYTAPVSKSAAGSSWFLSTVTNEKKVKKAVWMTSGLGVYDLFVNGKPRCLSVAV